MRTAKEFFDSISRLTKARYMEGDTGTVPPVAIIIREKRNEVVLIPDGIPKDEVAAFLREVLMEYGVHAVGYVTEAWVLHVDPERLPQVQDMIVATGGVQHISGREECIVATYFQPGKPMSDMMIPILTSAAGVRTLGKERRYYDVPRATGKFADGLTTNKEKTDE